MNKREIAIERLQANEHNGAWDEIRSLAELKKTLVHCIKHNTEEDDIPLVESYKAVLKSLK